jgi:uncharacterized protein YecE (DUF72 family)
VCDPEPGCRPHHGHATEPGIDSGKDAPVPGRVYEIDAARAFGGTRARFTGVRRLADDARVQLLTGTSGYSYPQWRGSFYPADLKDDDMLPHYAGRLPTVEINNTFYRIPKPDVVDTWKTRAPSPFSFVIKASQRISHHGKLKGENAHGSMRYLYTVIERLGDQLGAVLVQTPPYLRADVGVLSALLPCIPEGKKVAFELTHESWHTAEVDQLLLDAGHCRVVADKEDGTAAWPQLADWAYVRLRKDDYSTEKIGEWLQALRGKGVATAYVFFKHEDTARGAEMALELQRMNLMG